MTDITHESHFVWQVQYLVTLEDESCGSSKEYVCLEKNKDFFRTRNISKRRLNDIRIEFWLVS